MYQFYKNFYFKTSIFDLQYFIYFQPLLFYFNFLYQSYKHLHISYVRQHSVNRGMNDSGKKFWIRHILWDITCCMPIWSLTCPTPLYYCSLILPVQSLYSGVFSGVNSSVLPPPLPDLIFCDLHLHVLG